ncbi:hypothetical protein MATL_G00077840 [Megalops atlanticus]|uniref:Uncharacterized protein n=1 Tax=Megalops atlanticus TaxID=7932 RepID=A0A9D3Q908_MEGAT|nr:hypothetical protein MATL_G00077840 [Megalops atlanticus]
MQRLSLSLLPTPLSLTSITLKCCTLPCDSSFINYRQRRTTTSTYFNGFFLFISFCTAVCGKALVIMDLKVESEEMDCNRPVPIEVFASRSTLHGISHMFTYERICIRRCLWILFFLGSVSFLVCTCVDRIQFYFAYPHVTKLDEVSAPAILFPVVTFCNLNSFRFSRVTRNDLYHAGELLALLNRRYEIRDTHLVEDSVLETLKVKADFHNFKPRPFNMREFYDRTGHDIKDMLLSCHFRGIECSAEDFTVVSHLLSNHDDVCFTPAFNMTSDCLMTFEVVWHAVTVLTISFSQ